MVWLVLGGLGVALWVLDRLLVWCELRGWIYYRLTPRPVRQSLGNALMSVEAFYRPTKQHAIELLQDVHVIREDDGDAAGGDSGTRRCDDPCSTALRGARQDDAGPRSRRRRTARRRGKRA